LPEYTGMLDVFSSPQGVAVILNRNIDYKGQNIEEIIVRLQCIWIF
jgi:hypothetical protein